MDSVWQGTQGATICDFWKIREICNYGLLSFKGSEILFLDRDRHYGTEIAYIFTAQMLRASKGNIGFHACLCSIQYQGQRM